MCWCGLAIDWVCYYCCQSSLQGAANIFFVLIFAFVFVYFSVIVYEATRAWRPVACMFAQLERKPQNLPSFKAAADHHQKLRAHLLRELKLSEKPNSHFPELTSRVIYPLTSLFPAENLSLLASETLLTPLSRPPPARH